MAYEKQNWKNLPSKETPVNAERLNHIEEGIYENSIGKQETLVSGENIKTINNQSILGSGNITIEGGSGGGSYMPSIYDDVLEFLAGSNARVEGEELIF